MTAKLQLFYVYVMRDPRAGKNMQPIYVGKGRDGRVRVHWRKADDHRNPLLRRIFSKLRKSGLEPLIEVVRYFDIEADAFRHEIELIAQYGRRDLKSGTLCNLTDGGEGSAGCLVTAKRAGETMRKLHTDPDFARAQVERGRAIMRNLNANPEFSKNRAESLRKLHADPEYAKAQTDGVRKRWTDPEYAKAQTDRLRTYSTSPANIERARKILLNLHADPEFAKANAKRASEHILKLHANPEFARANAKRAGEILRKLHADPNFAKASAERARERMRKRHADPAYAKKHAERSRKTLQRLHADPEYAKANSERVRKLHTDPQYHIRAVAGLVAYWAKRRAMKAASLSTKRDCIT